MFDRIIKHKKIWVSLLTLAMIINLLPNGFKIFAAAIDNFSIVLVDGENRKVNVNDAVVILENASDKTLTAEAKVKNGVAEFQNFVEVDNEYKVIINDSKEVKELEESIVVKDNEKSKDVKVDIKKKLIRVEGKVYDHDKSYYANATIKYDGYVSGTVKTDEKGKFTFNGYEGTTVGISLQLSDEESKKYNVFTSDLITNLSSTSGIYYCSGFNLQLKSFSVETSVDDSIKGTITAGHEVVYGESSVINVKANDGYCIDQLLVNGKEIENAESQKNFDLELNEIKENQKVEVIFKAVKYNVSFTIGENGTVKYDNETLSNDIVVDFNESTDSSNPTKVTITAQPDKGYKVSKVIIDGKAKMIADENDFAYTTVLTVNKNLKVEVEFSKNTYNIILPKEDKFVSSNVSSLLFDESYVLTIDPETDKVIESVKVNGEVKQYSINQKGQYIVEVTNVQEDQKIEVIYKDIEKLPSEQYKELLSIATPVVEEGLVYIYNNDSTISVKEGNEYTLLRINGNKEVSSEFKFSVKTDITSIDLWNGKEFKRLVFEKENPLQINVDKSVPQLDIITKESTTYSKDSIVVEGFVTDEEGQIYNSELVKVVYYKQGEEHNLKSVEIKEGKFNIPFEDTTNDTYYFYAVDKAENKSEVKELVLMVDKVLPEFVGALYEVDNDTNLPNIIKGKGTFSNTTVKLNVEAKDEDSQLSKVILLKDDIELLTYLFKDKGNNIAVFELTQDNFGEGNISLKVIDKAGNEVTKTLSEINENYNSFLRINEDKTKLELGTEEEQYYELNLGNAYGWINKEKGDLSFEVKVTDKYFNIHQNEGVKVTLQQVNGQTTEINDFEITNNNSEEFVENSAIRFTVKNELLEVTGVYKLLVEVRNEAGSKTTNEFTINVDNTIPEITGFEFNPKNDGVVAKFINFLSFGLFFNEAVQVTVDSVDNELSNGLKETYLKVGEKEFGPIEIKDGKSTFTVPLETIAKPDLLLDGEIKAWVIDNCTNSSKETSATIENASEEVKNNLMIETVKPTINTEIHQEYKYSIDDKNWYDSDIDFTLNFADEHAGLNRVEYELIHTASKDNEDKGIVLSGDIDLSKELIKEHVVDLTTTHENDLQGEFVLNVKVTDNAWNVYEETTKVYKDTVNPEVSFKYGEGIVFEGDEIDFYSFYANKDTSISVTASEWEDVLSSMPKAIEYYLVYQTPTGEIKTSESTIVDVDDSNSIVVLIKAGFKGNIYAKAIDNVANTPDIFSSPDSTIVESNDHHNNEEEHINITLPETTNKTKGEEGKNNLYNSDVEVEVVVKDLYSGIREVEWSVNSDFDKDNNGEGKIAITNKGVFDKNNTDTGWEILTTDKNLVTEIKKVFTVSNNSNDIVFKVKMTDRSGNTSEDEVVFNIDKTAPVIELVYDNNDADEQYKDIYNANRVATITIKERNFDAKDVVSLITNTDSVIPNVDLTNMNNWKLTKDENPDNNIYTAKIKYSADGDYTFDIEYKDLAENKSNKIHDGFTLDKTNPTIKVEYDNNNALNGNYYAADRTATLTIVEHNFDPRRVNIIGVATDNGAPAVFPKLSNWTTKGDVHTATIHYSNDSLYSFDVEFNDKARNSIKEYAVEEFYVDKTAPTIEIAGVNNLSANNDVVAPNITFTDTNYNKNDVTIELVGVNSGKAKFYPTAEQIANGELFTYADFKRIKEIDDIYTLTVNTKDMAGNSTNNSITFSVNRYGSTYDLTKIKDINGKFIKIGDIRDLVFTEINVDTLDRDSIIIKLIKDGEAFELTENKDYTVKQGGGNGQWSTYTYTINKELINADARYELAVYSKDKANNINENIDETKEAEITFGVDGTLPVVIPVDFKSNGIYEGESKDVIVNIKDNLLLDNVVIKLNGEEIPYEVIGDDYKFTVPQSNKKQTVEIYVYDAANNETLVEVLNFTVSDNFFVRWYNNTPVFIASMIAMVGAASGLYFLIAKKKKENEEVEETN